MNSALWLLVAGGAGLGAALLLRGNVYNGPIPKNAQEWIPIVAPHAQREGIPLALPMSFIEHESGFRLNATRYECRCPGGKNFGQKTPCPSGCQRRDRLGRPIVSRGPFQFLIGTAELSGLPADRHEELNQDPNLAAQLGTALLGKLWRKFNGNLYYVAAAYNGGEGGAMKAYKAGTRVANNDAHLYAKTAQKLYAKWEARV